MAKKKTAETANIKAAPVLRSGDPTPVITKSYSVRDDWKDKGVVNYIAFKSVDGAVQDLTVNGQPAGGGGEDMLVVNATFGQEGHDSWYELDKTWTEISNAITTNPDSVVIIFGDTHFGLMPYSAITNNYGLHIVKCYTWYDQESSIDFVGDTDPSTPLKYNIH